MIFWKQTALEQERHSGRESAECASLWPNTIHVVSQVCASLCPTKALHINTPPLYYLVPALGQHCSKKKKRSVFPMLPPYLHRTFFAYTVSLYATNSNMFQNKSLSLFPPLAVMLHHIHKHNAKHFFLASWIHILTTDSRTFFRVPTGWDLVKWSSHHLVSLTSASQPGAKAQSEKATLEGRRPRLETERGNHGELQQWSWLKQTLVYVPLYLPLCAHTPHVKPSDACTAASLVNHNWGRGSSLLQSPPQSACKGGY